MNRRNLGLGLMGLGGLVTILGIVLWLGSGDVPSSNGTSTTTSISDATTSTQARPSTTQPGPTTSLATTTTVEVTTTTTLDTSAAIEEFIVAFNAAITGSDIDFLYDALHPSVPSLFGGDFCRQFIEDQILLLEDYRLTGGVEGPEIQNIDGADVELYRAPAAFTFQGEQFEAEAGFAFVGGMVRWLTTCE